MFLPLPVCFCWSIISDYLMKHWIGFTETCTKQSLDQHLQMNNLWCLLDSGLLLQQTNLKKLKIGNNLSHFYRR